VSLDTESHTLTVALNASGNEDVIRSSTRASFTLPIDVRISQPCNYDLGNGLTLAANRPHNVKVSISSKNYDETTETIEYTVTVEAESDLDFNQNAYLVRVQDSSVPEESGETPELSIVSGSFSYTYAEGNPPEEKPKAQVGEDEVSPGTATPFTQFPVNISHMYAGDKITFTYQAEVLKSEYKPDGEAQQHYIQNTVENVVKIFNEDSTGNPNPYNNPDDDEDSVTNPFSYIPLLKRQIALEGNWAHWEITVNPKGYTLNSG